jgi:hypothetical protein
MWAGIIAAAFTLRSSPLSSVPPHARCTAPLCSADPQLALSRRAALAAGASVAASCAAPAWAGYVTNLGIETTKPKDADVDDELLASKEVQAGLTAIASYRAAASALKLKFDADGSMPLIPVIRQEFDFSKLRDALNIVTTVFDDTTQETTDRVARSILYDLTELENASRLKKGETDRTPKKIANVNKWFGKLDKDFGELQAYFK